MDGKSVRTIAVMGLLAILAMTVLMMFSLRQVTDTQTPQIAADVADELQRGLAEEPPPSVRLVMQRDGKALDAPRTYTMRLRPNAEAAANLRTVDGIMYRAAEICAAELGDVKADVTIRCLADLGDRGEREARFHRDRPDDPGSLGLIRALAPPRTNAPSGRDAVSADPASH